MGGAVLHDLRRDLLLVPEDHRADAQRRRSGKLSFCLMFVGFLMTFLIQHVIGLDGMPRRVYEYDNVGHLALYNLISTVGSFILAAGVLATIINVARSLKVRRRSPGPDPWKANTLEWFTSSPPPVNNFDVVPLRALGRTDEGHPPRGRAAQRGVTRTSRRTARRRPQAGTQVGASG